MNKGANKQLKNEIFSRDRSGVKSAVVLLPLLGITWLFGILTFNSDTLAFQYLFAIFNSLQVCICQLMSHVL